MATPAPGPPRPNVGDLVGMDVDVPGNAVLAGGQRGAPKRAKKHGAAQLHEQAYSPIN